MTPYFHRLAATGAILAALLTTPQARAENVVCHLTYGGETQHIEARPSSTPYAEAANAIGSYFLFRVVFRQEPADLASIKIYTYANHAAGPAIIHQASYSYPPNTAAHGGFTGGQTVYEPLRDGELQYWCELKVAP